MPVGEFTGVLPMAKEITANIGKVGACSRALHVREAGQYGARSGWRGLEGNDVDFMTPEIAQWKANCKCRFSVYVIEDTSHDFPLHKSAEGTVKEMSRWLKSF